MTDRVSVLLPTFNRADLIGETIDSVLAQSRQVDEILVIDDGSTDATAQVVARYGDAVTYISKPNGGKSSALNLGLRHATGSLIWICDDDDLLLPHACERLAGRLEANPALGYCAGMHEDFIINPETGEAEIKAPGYLRASKPDEIFPDLLDGCHIFQPGLMVRRTTYDKVGPFREDLVRSQDYEMLLRIARATTGILLEEVVFQHREHLGDRGSATERFSMAQANEKWIRFHRIIMEPLLPDLADSEILPASVWDAPERADTRGRTAAIKRASVYARNQLWPEAANAWTTIAAGRPAPLDAYEEALVKGATLYSLGCDGLLYDKSVRQQVLVLKAQSALGKAILRLIARSLHWRLKAALVDRRFGRAWAILTFLLAAR